MFSILTINPGSTSTKIALYTAKAGNKVTETFSENIAHDSAITSKFKNPIDQLEFRMQAIKDVLQKNNINKLDCIVGRGGLSKPITAGSYAINDDLIKDLSNNTYGSHASNLGAIIATQLGKIFNCPAMIVDPVSVDELEPLARYSGLPSIKRVGRAHTLNIRAVARKYAADINSTMDKLNLIVVHMGGGISIAPLRNGKIIDVSDALSGGPFSPQRTGSLPVLQLIKLCFSGKYNDADSLIYEVTNKAGLLAYIGTDDGRVIAKRIEEGDKKTTEVFMAMAYQIAKEIGAMATVLNGKIDAILLTGGLARPILSDWIEERVGWIAPVKLYTGEFEQEALAEGGARYLFKQEQLKEY